MWRVAVKGLCESDSLNNLAAEQRKSFLGVFEQVREVGTSQLFLPDWWVL